MEVRTGQQDIAYSRLVEIFKPRSKYTLVLPAAIGTGILKVLRLEKGLQVKLWQCNFHRPLMIDGKDKTHTPFFNLVFFDAAKGIELDGQSAGIYQYNDWDMAFIPSDSDVRMVVKPGIPQHCVTVSFSKEWLFTNLAPAGKASGTGLATFPGIGASSIFSSMNADDKMAIDELISMVSTRSEVFKVKVAVLKIVSAFFQRTRFVETISSRPVVKASSLDAVVQLLLSGLHGKMPGLEALAKEMSVSASTLKRMFRKEYGVSISAYFLSRKMELAHRLIQRDCVPSVVARELGYRSLSSFMNLYRKYGPAT